MRAQPLEAGGVGNGGENNSGTGAESIIRGVDASCLDGLRLAATVETRVTSLERLMSDSLCDGESLCFSSCQTRLRISPQRVDDAIWSSRSSIRLVRCGHKRTSACWRSVSDVSNQITTQWGQVGGHRSRVALMLLAAQLTRDSLSVTKVRLRTLVKGQTLVA